MVEDICRKLGVAQSTFYKWQKEFGGLSCQDLKELRMLREENARLKKLVADLSLDKHMLQEIVSKKL